MERLKEFGAYFKSILPSLAVAVTVWLVLQIAACMGFRPALLWPFNYLSGALAGLTGTSRLGMIGGSIGRAVIFIFFEKAIWILLFSKKPVKERFLQSGKLLGKKFLYMVPYVKKIKSWIVKDPVQLGAQIAGCGIALILSLFLSGNGKLVNSFVSVALMTEAASQLQLHKGLIWNTFKKLSDIIKADTADHFLTGLTLGFALGALISSAKILRLAGWILSGAGMAMIFIAKAMNKKPAKA